MEVEVVRVARRIRGGRSLAGRTPTRCDDDHSGSCECSCVWRVSLKIFATERSPTRVGYEHESQSDVAALGMRIGGDAGESITDLRTSCNQDGRCSLDCS